MKNTNLRFLFLLALSTLMGCALGQSATHDAGTTTAGQRAASGLAHAHTSSASAHRTAERLQ